MTTKRLSDYVSVRGRFHRSVNVPRDWEQGLDLSGYLVTPTIRELAEQIQTELTKPEGTRSWSITGPYGSGKSAFALFLADLFSADEPTHPVAQKLSEKHGYPVAPLVPVLLVAERRALIGSLADALAEAFESASKSVVRKARGLGDSPSSETLAELYMEAADAAARAGYGGLLLVIDELGKFLEFAAVEPGAGDVFVLQQLAEAAARSETPILFVTILHSGFAEYLGMGDELQRIEWQKVQGRFRDVAFQLPAEQMLALVGQALSSDPPEKLAEGWQRAVDAALASPALSEARERLPLDRLLPRCVPLHPVAALLLWPLFRSKVAQNERSLFAFLTSAEPFGLQHFLRTTWSGGDDAPLYHAASLYDYVTSALGLAAFTGDHARKWSLIDYALSRIPKEAPHGCRAVVKAIGLLSVYGPAVGLVASPETLEVTVGEPVEDALRFLERHSIAVYRRHLGGYALWEGSDVDLDAALQEARRRVAGGDLISRLRRVVELRPVVARAHYVETGTLRFLDVDVVSASEEELRDALRQPTRADGRLLFALGNADLGPDGVVELACCLTRECEDPLRVVAVPQSFEGLDEALRELECWIWVGRNVPELQGDPVARQEVRARTSAARDRFERLAGRVFGLAGSPFEPQRSTWVASGETCSLASPIEFQRWFSRLCEETFHKAPSLHNELLNRQDLSSAATAARRNLLERMVENPAEERLGIEGTPAEASMYESLLRVGSFHRVRKGEWSLGPPKEDWRPAWDAAVAFVRETKGTRRPVTELLTRLRKPPYGIRDGPLPVLLWALLLSKRDEIAVYEEGVFVPELRVEVIERLTRRPGTFELQSQDLDDHQVTALRALRRVLGKESGPAAGSESEFLPIVKSLIQFAARLEPFARRTKRLSPPASVEVREHLLDARDPRSMLFEELPSVLCVDLGREGGDQEFASRLRECLVGMGRAYPDLLDNIETQLREVFALTGPAVEARRQLAARAAALVPYAVDQRLKLFVAEAAANRREQDWRESLGRVLSDGLPPSHWSDREATAFQVRLQEVASDFFRLEELVAEKEKTGVGTILRIGILDAGHRERRAVIPLGDEYVGEVVELASRVSDALAGNGGAANGSTHVRLAALARVAAGILEEVQGEGGADGGRRSTHRSDLGGEG